ncbi:MAG TPA: hypothetical protein VNF68_08705 [Candidatus Baltobacteraceae bacterium]|nr:hypothetical protein [Candidatus Baltobacteraceae bacterium]
MTVATPQSSLGRHVFGTAVLASGLATLVWHTGPVYLSILAAAQVLGGIAIQIRPAARAGALIIGMAYLVLALLCIPQIVARPGIYAAWGNFFYPFANVIGAATAYALLTPTPLPRAWLRIACILFALCNVSFAIEQVEYLARTASLVPAWIPPNQMFWAVTTTVPFALVAIALLIDRKAILASRLFAAMFWAFGLLVWLPLLFSKPHVFSNWNEGTETVAIGAAGWILADLIARSRRSP